MKPTFEIDLPIQSNVTDRNKHSEFRRETINGERSRLVEAEVRQLFPLTDLLVESPTVVFEEVTPKGNSVG